MKCTVEYSDLLKFHFLAAPAFSPDSGRIAYKAAQANRETNGYDTDIWIYDLAMNENRRLTDSGNADFFCWGLDGQKIIFAVKQDNPKCSYAHKPSITRFCVLPASGGEPEPLFNIPHKATALRALDEDRYLITTVFDPVPPENPEEASFMIFDQVPFMANGKGYVGQRRTGLGIYDTARKEFRRLTSPILDVSCVTLNDERTAALIVASAYEDVKPINNGVYRLDLASGKCELLSSGLDVTFSCAVWDEEDILVTVTDHQAQGVNENPDICLLKDGELICLTAPDVSLGHAVVADTSYGCTEREGAIVSSPLGPVCCATQGFKTRLCSIRRDGSLGALTSTISSVIDYAVQGERIAFIAYQDLHLPELFVFEKGTERRLTSFNDAFYEGHALSQPIHITFRASGGLMLDGWYMRPIGYQEGSRCPTILNIHGGPKAAFGDIYHHEMQCWAAKGYAVIYCNPRGSDGRGGEFSDIRGRYGETDYRDIMDFTDWCVQNLNFVDASRLGVTGGSYGGFMTNWIITHTNRFRAAVSQRGIANWVSKFGGCDIGYYYVEDQHKGTPWKNPAGPWQDSPVAYANSASTPTLFVHSTEDYRCELNQGFQMFTALRVNGVEARMCVFRGENHELSRSGKPRNRLARLRVITEWFDTRL
ncbi:MAG: S9 family peptidase [Fretibacterium sp.]|nr:S9 family peptidase [Fretibacterium sp.]